MASNSERVIDASGLVKYYPITRGIVFKKKIGDVRAVDHVDLTLNQGETLAIVGESGCGKSTTGRLLMGLEPVTEGTIEVLGEDITSMSAKELRLKRRDIQIILQDPYTSLNPRMTVASIIGEPFEIHPDALNGRTKKEAVHDLMDRVGLNPEFINRYPHQFSGGQRQRIGVARALALNPKIIVADEPVSALDVSVQAQVMNLLLDLRDELGLSYIFISHDLAVVRQIADRIAVMDEDIPTASGVKVGTPFSELYKQAFGNCTSVPSDDEVAVECKAEGSQHISYVFTGTWSGPEGLMPSDDTLKSWKVSKILWKQ